MARKRTTGPEPAQSVKKPADVPPEGYQELLAELKERIRSAQLRAGVAVNREMIVLYWQIGRDILIRQEKEGWGTKVIDRLAADLRRAYPDMTGLSPRNLKYMRAFAEAWPEEPIVQQLVAQIPWGHCVRLLDHVKNRREREWYIRKTIQNRSDASSAAECYRQEDGACRDLGQQSVTQRDLVRLSGQSRGTLPEGLSEATAMTKPAPTLISQISKKQRDVVQKIFEHEGANLSRDELFHWTEENLKTNTRDAKQAARSNDGLRIHFKNRFGCTDEEADAMMVRSTYETNLVARGVARRIVTGNPEELEAALSLSARFSWVGTCYPGQPWGGALPQRLDGA